MRKSIAIGIIGDFNPDSSSHIATNQALGDAAAFLGLDIKIDWLPTSSFQKKTARNLAQKYNGLIAGSSPYQSEEGIIKGISLAREMNIPFIGT